MKKRKKLQELNCWVVISIIVYVLIWILLVIAAFLSSDPKHSLWSFAAVVWAILGFLLPKKTYSQMEKAIKKCTMICLN